MDLSLVDAWLYFPGLKVGQIYLCSSFWLLEYWVALIIKRDTVRSTVIPELRVRLELFSRLILSILDSDFWFAQVFCSISRMWFFLLSQGSFKNNFVELLKIRPVFLPHNFVFGKQSKTLQAKCN
jgi:hypothetical protein